MDDKLSTYFRKNKWGDESSETVSGSGSTLKYTENLRQKLPALLKKYDVKVFLDAPCGDFNWMKEVGLSDIQYIGMDIVPDLIIQNHSRYARVGRVFLAGDITRDALPMSDLMQCRDCLFHLPYKDIVRFLDNFARSTIPYLLTTTHLLTHNKDIERPGQWRQLNLKRPPFRFPEPLETIDDWIEGHPRRQMGLWTIEQVAEAAKRARRQLEAIP